MLLLVITSLAAICSVSTSYILEKRGVVVKWCESADSYLYTYSSGISSYDDLASAQAACLERDDCGGITQEPYNNNRYTLRVGPELHEGVSPTDEISWTVCETEKVNWCEFADSYLYTYSSGTSSYDDLASAQAACLERDDCGGITQEPYNNNRYTLRVGPELKEGVSPTDEISWTVCETTETGGTCPQNYPNVYYNGDYCCEHDEEKYYEPQGELCDNSTIGLDSLCCKDNAFQQCSDPPCSNYEEI